MTSEKGRTRELQIEAVERVLRTKRVRSAYCVDALACSPREVAEAILAALDEQP